jgi:hypothetical protein
MYETYEHQNQGLVTPKLAPMNLVLPKGFNMWILQIFVPPSLNLRLLESLENYNTYIINIQYKCQNMGECNSYTLNCDYSLCTPTQQILSSYFEMCWYCITFIQKHTTLLWNELIGNTWINNPMLHYLYPLKEVFTMRITKKTIPTSKWQIPYWKGYGMGNTLIYHNKKSLCPM